MTLIERINAYKAQTQISQAQLAREAGLSAGALSAYLNGNYKGNNQDIESKLTALLERKQQEANRFIHAPDFIQTPTASHIFTALEYALISHCLATIYGASGVGKTQAIKAFARQTPNCWLITASPARASLSEILYEIAQCLGLNALSRHKGKLSRAILAKIKDTQGLLIIDEADHLPYVALEELRILQEEAGIGLVLVGNDKIYTRMKGGISPTDEYARLWSRIAKNYALPKVKQADILAIADAWGLSADKTALELLTQITQTGGGLRMLTQTLRLAAITAKGANQALNSDFIAAARRDLLGI